MHFLHIPPPVKIKSAFMILKNVLTFDTAFRATVGIISTLAALDMSVILLRVNDNSTFGYSRGDYAIGLKHLSVKEGDLTVIVDPFENSEKLRRVVAKESKFMFSQEGKRLRRRNLLVPAAHWWCESDIPDAATGSLDSYAVHQHMVEGKVVLKVSGGSLSLTP